MEDYLEYYLSVPCSASFTTYNINERPQEHRLPEKFLNMVVKKNLVECYPDIESDPYSFKFKTLGRTLGEL